MNRADLSADEQKDRWCWSGSVTMAAAVEQCGFKTGLNQPGLLWQLVAFERTSGGAH